MILYFIDGECFEISPVEFTLKFFSKDTTKESDDNIMLEYNGGEFSLYGGVEDFSKILYAMLDAVNENKEDA